MEHIVVIVRVQSPEGTPVEGASVSFESAVAVLPEIALTTGPDGTLEAKLPAGLTRVRADFSGLHTVTDINLSTTEDHHPVEIMLKLPPSP